MRLAVIGMGRVGQSLALALIRSGSDPLVVVARRPEDSMRWAEILAGSDAGSSVPVRGMTPREAVAWADTVLLAVRDDDIRSLASQWMPLARPGACWIHFSGFHAARVMKHSNYPQIACGSLHPLTAVAEPDPDVFQGVPAAVEGDDEAVEVAYRLARRLGAHPWTLRSEEKPRYHAAAFLAAAGIATLLETAVELLAQRGILERDAAYPALKSLAIGACEGMRRLGPAEGLTGPVVRGDGNTVMGHLEAIADAQEVAALYRCLVEKMLTWLPADPERGTIRAQLAHGGGRGL